MGRILISAGHTIMDPGAVYRDLREADLTRDIAKRIIPYLEKAKATVQGVPLDLPLYQRVQWINNTGYTAEQEDLLVEVHINDGGKRGVEAWYRGEGNNDSQKLAHTLTEFLAANGYQSQGIKSEFQHELGTLTFLNRSNPAAVLLETLYIDNDEDIILLKNSDELEKLAKLIAQGILKFQGKDLDGNPLLEDQLQKYDNLQPFKRDNSQPESPVSALNRSAVQSPPSFVPFPPVPTPGKIDFGMPSNALPTPTTPSFSSGVMQDRASREKMVKERYVQLLGHEPNMNELNYFLNTGTTEQELILKIADSQEHADLVKAKKELDEIKKTKEDLEKEIQKITVASKDQQQMLVQLNMLLQQKNQAIQDLNNQFIHVKGVPSHVIQIDQEKKNNNTEPLIPAGGKHTKPTSWEKLVRFISRYLPS